MLSIITILFVMGTMSTSSISSKVNALDLDNFGIGDIGQSAECVIVVIGCDGTGSVGSSGDTIIGSNNGNNDNNTNDGGNELGTLTVIKQVVCNSVNSQPNDDAFCDYVLTLNNFATPSDFPIAVTGNNPNPSSFPGNAGGTEVSIGSGSYVISEPLVNITAPSNSELGNPQGISLEATASGDCNPDLSQLPLSFRATGEMTSGGSQECSITNTFTITGGSIPSG
ncbi:hypothetical protein [Candidatus Nitrosocosmicus hydrocola]|uniref:hypothetical protein n=1 Tax=Candidatus Nitrosocosmicus hydrocola TaxID=1826872 RepID=UPI00137308EB|nr:hypothetical protein [Candidatus Nitrosocosmicus hydrocola]